MLIGIDLGTTFSAVAVIRDDGKAEIITNRDGERTTPSVVMFEDGNVIVGEQAKENSVIDPYNVCQFVKRQMGKKAFSFDVSMDESYSAEDISAMILKRLKEDAEAACRESIEGAIVTVPAYFDDAQRKATQDAGEIAGLNVLGIINEPTAAAIAYCHGQSNSDGNIMVYDLGGGTFDITIMRVTDNFGKVDILATTGNRNLGGFDIDNAIISKVVEEFSAKHDIDLEDDDMAVQELRIKAENAKKALSSRKKASVSIVSGGKALKVEITRDEFNTMIKRYIDSTRTSMELAMEDANLKWSDISKILLVGGSTRIPAVQDMIKDLTGIEPSYELNPDEAVAIGAAYYADTVYSKATGNNTKAEKTVEVQDVNSHSLGIISINSETKKREAAFIIKRNTPLPASAQRVFYTMEDGQSNINLEVVEGEDTDPEYDTVIGRGPIKLTPRPQGSPVLVSMEYDLNGIIHIIVTDNIDHTNRGEIQIERDSNLSKQDIKKKKSIIGVIDID